MFPYVLFLKIANEKPKLEGEWKAGKDRKKFQGQEVTIYSLYWREKANPKGDRSFMCFIVCRVSMH